MSKLTYEDKIKSYQKKIDELCNKEDRLKVLKVDVDQHMDLVREHRITLVPTFNLYHKRNKRKTFNLLVSRIYVLSISN